MSFPREPIGRKALLLMAAKIEFPYYLTSPVLLSYHTLDRRHKTASLPNSGGPIMIPMTLNELWNNLSDIPTARGIYRILLPADLEIVFQDEISNHPGDAYPIEALQDKYGKSKSSNILYIGKANGKRGLHQRLGQYMRYGFGTGKNHRGGRAIFQISGFEKLLCEYETCEDCEDEEHRLLDNFRQTYGTLPLANWKR